jgi:hypothetical protein
MALARDDGEDGRKTVVDIHPEGIEGVQAEAQQRERREEILEGFE